jgi:hypothetical protein
MQTKLLLTKRVLNLSIWVTTISLPSVILLSYFLLEFYTLTASLIHTLTVCNIKIFATEKLKVRRISRIFLLKIMVILSAIIQS